MKISRLIKELQAIKKKEGDIEVTCTGSTIPDRKEWDTDVFESTVENLIVNRKHPAHGKAVRIWM